MNEILTFFAGVLSTLPLYYITLRNRKRQEETSLKALENICYEELAALIDKMNHEGPIPNGASASGLLNLTLLAIRKTIITLEQYAKERGWNLQIPISELRGIVMVELTLLKQKLDDFIEAKRNILKDYHIEK